MEYYLTSFDWAVGWDGSQMYLLTKDGLKPVSGRPDPYWGGLTEEEAWSFAI